MFYAYTTPFETILDCTNITDKFSMNNNKAKLKYPVGLLTKGKYWTATPLIAYFSMRIRPEYIVALPYSYTSSRGTTEESGVRPVISLKPGTKYSSGDGSMANPYVIKVES